MIIHTSKGTLDTRFVHSNDILKNKGLSITEIRTLTSSRYGKALRSIARQVITTTAVQRLVIAAEATHRAWWRGRSVSKPSKCSPRYPLAHHSTDGLEVNFKGGQVG
ncbi:MAG: hypothetical protein J7619_03365 [Dyadobacter sp.]|uniref:hypothetical protein n=1 Tax=Dyadobacter sp. TaxID=1914288 RepID=UPI001B2B8080|nr:hypothetical protein [Dyadobacter sp.]MBO9611705.1 hypothetical protein [Dyadobacter sp.]